jgi:hypothetical protein
MVQATNHSPQVSATLGDRGLAFGSSVDLDLARGFRDPDQGDALRYSLTLSNAQGQAGSWLAIRDGHLVGSATGADAGVWDLQIQAMDGQGLTTSQSLRWVVGGSNQPPTVRSSAPATVLLNQNDTLRLDIPGLFSDGDLAPGERLSYRIDSASGESIAWLQSAVAAMGPDQQLSLVTDNSMVGSHDLILRATDPQGLSAEHRLALVITNVNDAPTLVRPSALATGVGLWEERFQLTPATPLQLDLAGLFADPDQLLGQAAPTLTLRNANGEAVPAWVTWDPATGQLRAEPGDRRRRLLRPGSRSQGIPRG